ncbi:serine hydrolase [Kordiimonas sediminis]|uniref:Serine hydrolase n=1 Tax=Kordiimonas sediminis TaxID=1735581 RepID=A0A919AN69_9PROT|nr:serine hydrolase domain-containing protein [Kordiimonas sediminis]GHF16852.1 serine hydrolase [Kordiimonas sediminis]
MHDQKFCKLFRTFSIAALAILSASVAAIHTPAMAAEDAVTPAASVGFPPHKLDAVRTHFQGYVDSGKLAGLTTLISKDGQIVHFDTYGKQNLETGDAMQLDTIFRIYSMTKPVTGVALMQLWEQGHFKLDDPVYKYIPAFKDTPVFTGLAEDGTMQTEPQARPMTILDLMRHTSGMTYGAFGNTPVDQAYRKAEVLTEDINLQQFVDRVAAIPLLAQPGEKWIYSVSVDVQGYLVELFSGMTLDQYFEEKIFKPLGMKDTGFYVPEEKTDRFVEIYTYDDAGALIPADGPDFTRNFAFKSGGGGLVSTTRDYWKFSQMLLNKGTLGTATVLKPETIDLMVQNHLPAHIKGIAGQDKLGFGLNFSVLQNSPEGSSRGSNGMFAWGGMANTVFWVDPKEQLIALFMTNVLPSQVFPFREELQRLIYPLRDDSAGQ